VSNILCPTFWIDCGGLDISLVDQDVELLFKKVVWIMSNCALCVVCDCCLCGS
jgi:hypothetical protein